MTSQKQEGRAFADNIRQPEEMKNALVWLFDTDASQLTGFLRSGPASGRHKLMLACSRAVCEPPNTASASADGPPVASTSKGSASNQPASVASDVQAAPAASEATNPPPDGSGDDAAPSSGQTKEANEPPSDAPATSVAQADLNAGAADAPIASAGGGTAPAAAVASDPSGSPAPPEVTSPAPSRFDHVVPPTFVDTSEVPRRAKVSTRQVLCCRETCSICYQACCGYSSELPQDSHFLASDVHHRCKSCYRASRNRATEAPTSTQASGDTSQDTHDPWYHTSDSTGSWQQSPGWSSGHWEWDSWSNQWMWH